MDIVGQLEHTGVTCWIAPRDVKPGAVYADWIYYALDSARVFVVLMSKAANGSKHVVRELEIAEQKGKRIVPVLLEQFEFTGAFCYYLRAAHFYRWQSDPKHVLATIAEQVQRATSNFEHPREPDNLTMGSEHSMTKPWWKVW